MWAALPNNPVLAARFHHLTTFRQVSLVHGRATRRSALGLLRRERHGFLPISSSLTAAANRVDRFAKTTFVVESANPSPRNHA